MNGHENNCLVCSDAIERTLNTYYNQFEASERYFDVGNNGFGLAHLPFSYLREEYYVPTYWSKTQIVLYALSQNHRQSHKRSLCQNSINHFICKFISAPTKYIHSGHQISWTYTCDNKSIPNSNNNVNPNISTDSVFSSKRKRHLYTRVKKSRRESKR